VQEAKAWVEKKISAAADIGPIAVAQIDWLQVVLSKGKVSHIMALRHIKVTTPDGSATLALVAPGETYSCPKKLGKRVVVAEADGGEEGTPLCITFWKNPRLEVYAPPSWHDCTVSLTIAPGMEAWLGADVKASDLWGSSIDNATLRALPAPEGKQLEIVNVGWEDAPALVGVIRGFLSPERTHELTLSVARAPWSMSRWAVRSSETQRQLSRRNCNFSAIPAHWEPHSHIGGVCGTEKVHDYPPLGAILKDVAALIGVEDSTGLLSEGNLYDHSWSKCEINYHGDGERGPKGGGFVLCLRLGGKDLDMSFARRIGKNIEGTTTISLKAGDMYIMTAGALGSGFSVDAAKGRRNLVHGVYRDGPPAEKPKKRRAEEMDNEDEDA
jgi:hypothetical protein